MEFKNLIPYRPAGPSKVVVTGSFDNWSQKHFLNRDPEKGSFSLVLDLNTTKVVYKYVVDGEWRLDQTHSIETESNGNQNNFMEKVSL